MSGIQDFWEFVDDFNGAGLFGAASAFDPWVATLSGTTPTATRMDHGETAGVFRPGVAQLLFVGTDAQNACLNFGDRLSIDFNKLRGFECGIRFVAQTGSAKDSNTTLAFGISGDRNDAIDTIAYQACFRLKAADTGMGVTCESDDATNDKTAASGLTMTDLSWFKFKIDFSNQSDVKFYGGLASGELARLCASTTYDMSNYSAGIQPFVQLQKATDANTDAVQVDYIRLWGFRQ